MKNYDLKKNILGISFVADSGVSLYQSGELKLAVNEERLTRIKLDGTFPTNSINWILQESGLRPSDIDLICFGFTNGMKSGDFEKNLKARIKNYSEDKNVEEIIQKRILTESEIDLKWKKEFKEKINKIFPQVPIFYCHHHEAHFACAYMNSPFKDSLVLTSDGRGDFLSITLNEVKNGILTNELYKNYSWESLGYFYGRITHLCGFVAQRHEGKITGLAANGNPETAKNLMKKMIDFDGENIIVYPGDYYRPWFTNYSDVLLEEIKKYSKEDLAAAAQDHLEYMVTKLVAKYAKATGLRNICLAGGVFGNVKLNQRIKDLEEIKEVYIYPHMGDGGLCSGSVDYYFMTKEKMKNKPMKNVYLGPNINPEILKNELKKKDLIIIKPKNINDEVVKILNSKKTIGLIQGRTEFGPRSLGNRSIIASSKNKDFCDKINKRLGRTEFMPFAPAIASNLAGLSLKNYNEELSSRQMTITYDVTDEFKKSCSATVHVDGTARPQVVFEEDNRFFYLLLNEWYKKTGELSLINTSFNLHEDPIVSNADDIVYTFLSNSVDYLLFPPYLAKYDKN